MKEWIKEHKIELLVLLLFLIGWGVRIQVDGLFMNNPGNIKAADPFWHVLEAQWIVDSESYGLIPPYDAEGHKDIVNMYPPLNYLATASISKVSGIPVWNIMYLLVTLFDALGIILLYILTTRIFNSKLTGVIAAAIYVFPLPLDKWWYNMSIGIWNNILGLGFFFAAMWLAYEYFREPKRWKIFSFAVMLTGAWLAHLAELFLIGFFAAVIGIHILWKTKPWKEKVIQAALLGILPFTCIILFWPRYKIWSGFATMGFSWNLQKIGEMPFFNSMWELPWWLLTLFFVGAILVMINYKKYKELIVGEGYLLMYLMVFPLILSSYYFFVRQRTALPFVIAPIAAFGAYQLFLILQKKIKIKKEFLITGTILFLLLFPLSSYQDLRQNYSGQHLTPEKYAALQWIDKTLPPDAELFFLTGYYQTSSMYCKRVGFVVDLPILQKELQSFYSTGNLTTEFLTEDHGTTLQALAYQKSFFSFGKYEQRDSQKLNVLDFKYIVMMDFHPQVKPFNDAMKKLLTEKYNYHLVYNRDDIYILAKEEDKTEVKQ